MTESPQLWIDPYWKCAKNQLTSSRVKFAFPGWVNIFLRKIAWSPKNENLHKHNKKVSICWMITIRLIFFLPWVCTLVSPPLHFDRHLLDRWKCRGGGVRKYIISLVLPSPPHFDRNLLDRSKCGGRKLKYTTTVNENVFYSLFNWRNRNFWRWMVRNYSDEIIKLDKKRYHWGKQLPSYCFSRKR